PNPRARTATIRALGKLGDSSALPRLRQLSQTECLDMIRGALLDAISRLESPPNSLSTI
ncbi:MAG: HEAT repeat domain-containing protein, partial [Acidobacteria bacterium]|nr:HEAT repeat domain-containing protein [Acidobacteriota bacterium]